MFISALILIAAVGVSAMAWLGYTLSHRVHGQYFDSNGTRIHYTVEGEGEPVVLIHGLAVNADLNWRTPGVTRALAKHFRVISLDNRGHGLSDKSCEQGNYGTEMVEDIIRLLDHLKIEKAHVAGYSMGGFITLKMVTMYPERLLSAAPTAAGWEDPNGDQRGRVDELASSLTEGQGFGALVRLLEPGGGEPNPIKMAVLNGFMAYLNDQKAVARVVAQIEELSVTEDQLRSNQVPVLSIVGAKDPLRTGVDAMVGVMANHEAVFIAGADHISAIRRKEYVDSLKSFFARHPAIPMPAGTES